MYCKIILCIIFLTLVHLRKKIYQSIVFLLFLF